MEIRFAQSTAMKQQSYESVDEYERGMLVTPVWMGKDEMMC